MSSLRLLAKKAPPAPPEPDPAPIPAALMPSDPTSEEKAKRGNTRAEREHRKQLAAKLLRERHIRTGLPTLRRRWPELFTIPVPLLVSAKAQIWAKMPDEQFRDVIRFWTNSTAYLLAVATGVERRNLNGSPAGVPTKDQQVFAQEALRRRGKWPVEGQWAAEAPVADKRPEGNPA